MRTSVDLLTILYNKMCIFIFMSYNSNIIYLNVFYSPNPTSLQETFLLLEAMIQVISEIPLWHLSSVPRHSLMDSKHRLDFGNNKKSRCRVDAPAWEFHALPNMSWWTVHVCWSVCLGKNPLFHSSGLFSLFLLLLWHQSLESNLILHNHLPQFFLVLGDWHPLFYFK